MLNTKSITPTEPVAIATNQSLDFDSHMIAIYEDKHRVSNMIKEESRLKNEAYEFIISKGLYKEFEAFSR